MIGFRFSILFIIPKLTWKRYGKTSCILSKFNVNVVHDLSGAEALSLLNVSPVASQDKVQTFMKFNLTFFQARLWLRWNLVNSVPVSRLLLG